MHLNKVVIIGRVGGRGPKLTYNEHAIPTCSLTVELDEVTHTGQVFTTYVPVEVVGKYAEAVAERLEAGQEVLVEGRLKYRKLTDKSGQATSKLIVTSWQVTVAPSPGPTDPASPPPADPPAKAVSKSRRPRYPKWTPEHAN